MQYYVIKYHNWKTNFGKPISRIITIMKKVTIRVIIGVIITMTIKLIMIQNVITVILVIMITLKVLVMISVIKVKIKVMFYSLKLFKTSFL